jgi:hypothetical protein
MYSTAVLRHSFGVSLAVHPLDIKETLPFVLGTSVCNERGAGASGPALVCHIKVGPGLKLSFA